MKIKSIKISSFQGRINLTINKFGAPCVDYSFDSYEKMVELFPQIKEIKKEIEGEKNDQE